LVLPNIAHKVDEEGSNWAGHTIDSALDREPRTIKSITKKNGGNKCATSPDHRYAAAQDPARLQAQPKPLMRLRLRGVILSDGWHQYWHLGRYGAQNQSWTVQIGTHRVQPTQGDFTWV